MATSLGPVARRKREKASQPDGGSSSLSADQQKSRVWSYYTRLGGTCVECNVCRKQLSLHNNTSGMREHLERWHGTHGTHGSSFPHPADDKELDFPSQDGAPKRPRQTLPGKDMCRSAADTRTGVIAELVLDMVCHDLHPLSVVEDKGFGLLFGYLEPNFTLPSPAQLSGLLWHRYALAKQRLKLRLQDAGAVALCVETWTANANQPCQAVTANVLDGEWRLAKYLLENQRLHPRNTADDPTDRLYSLAVEFGLPADAVSCVVHERPASVKSYGPALMESRGWASVCCTARALHLCVREGLEVPPVREALVAARGFIGFFQQDAKAAGCLNAKLESMSKARPGLDAESCWISTLEMCQNLLDIKWAVLAVVEELAVENLADQHWKLLQDVVPVLKTIWIATVFLQEEENVSVSSVMPCVHGILTACQHFSEVCGSAVKLAVNQIRAELCRQWDVTREDQLLAGPSVMASFLDPRYKELRFLKVGSREDLHSRVVTLLASDAHPELPPEPLVSCRIEEEACQLSAQSAMYDLLLGRDPAENTPEARRQLEDYIVEPVCKRSTDPLLWWKNNQHRFPALAKLARRYLAIPATAAGPQRAFSARLGPMVQRRAALDPRHVDAILFLHHNADLLDPTKIT
ncbi:E3 SUMO-protein ligase ZBED1-like [Spea bombifrons]|uniref:E3 SUMO-protein ligase ZBED1-like n=1 Tax=Spea bombifrons TaxID=233779 RepID=UPI00234A4695|nr:E3 SUMO-protein ligase ZBED1-like [Spea bombifrons]